MWSGTIFGSRCLTKSLFDINEERHLSRYASMPFKGNYPSKSRYKHCASKYILPCVFTQVSVDRGNQSINIYCLRFSKLP